MTQPIVLMMEDDETLGASLRQRLGLEGFSVVWVRSARQAREQVGKMRPAIILCDIRLPDGDGETIMREAFGTMGLVPTIFMTAYGDIDQAVRLVRDGALDYVTKPFDIDALVERLQVLAANAAIAPAANDDPFAGSASLAPIAETLRRAAPTDLPVLLLGETGTGKEVAARYLHAAGPRAKAPFVPVNCGALPSDLADSMLFGHERGAFTGATGSHRGFIEEAGEGTLFLDEVGDLPLALQVKLLRVLETREFRRLGSLETRRFAGRLVCATNRDLTALMAEDRFREDLWYRINVVTVTLPPLRERTADLPELVGRLTARIAGASGRPGLSVSAEAMEAAHNHRWPGNIRELVNRLERAVVLGQGSEITARDLFPEGLPGAASASSRPATGELPTLADAREEAERSHIVEALSRTSGSIGEAATLLGVSRTTLWEKMRRYGIEGG